MNFSKKRNFSCSIFNKKENLTPLSGTTHRNLQKFCNDNMINEQHLKTASMIEEQLKQIAIEQKVTFSTCGADFMKMR